MQSLSATLDCILEVYHKLFQKLGMKWYLSGHELLPIKIKYYFDYFTTIQSKGTYLLHCL